MKEYHTVGTVQKSDIIDRRGKSDALSTFIHDRSPSWLVITGASIKRGGVKLVLWVKTFPLREMMRSTKCFPHVSKITALAYRKS